jgi:RNA polymerase sigma factor (sigma-70 family)
VNVPEAIEVLMNGSTAYATNDDFCHVFAEKMDKLYLLGLLLTGDAAKAEQCFVAGIGDNVEGNKVFREWAYSWARRTIIRRAIQMIEPAEKLTITDPQEVSLNIEPRLRAILKLNTLERFVFVMSVLEGYSYRDCSVLLGCSRQAVANARARALEHLAGEPNIIAAHGEKLQGAYMPVSH